MSTVSNLPFKKTLLTLGVESSCDDTAVAIIDENRTILANIVISQNNEHEVYQGVVPEIAARSHMKNLKKALQLALLEAKLDITDIDIVSATCGPGLIGGVIVGAMFGKAIASTLGIPFIGVNHLEGHALTARLTHDVPYPYLLLLASGGHCQFVAVQGLGKYKILGQTLDDSVGEAFDKIAKMLGLGFPGGPEIEKMAVNGNLGRFIFPCPLMTSKNCDMSFSGLKTAVRLQIDKLGALKDQDIADIAASFQHTVTKIIGIKTTYAIAEYENYVNQQLERKTLVAAGGVAANGAIRQVMAELAQQAGYNFVAPSVKLCTDNAAMIAFAGLERFKAGIINDVGFKPRARWSLEE